MKKKKAKMLLKNTIKWILPEARKAKTDYQNGCFQHNTVIEEATRKTRYETLKEVCIKLVLPKEDL